VFEGGKAEWGIGASKKAVVLDLYYL
jgi:hypothetical protein